MAKLKCAICGRKKVKYELFITTSPFMERDLIDKDLCENCANYLAKEIKKLIRKMRKEKLRDKKLNDNF
jgi:formate dehydrogenase maturation protein FdhE